MSRKRLQHVFSITVFRLPRRLAKTSRRRLEGISKDVLKTCLEDVLKTYLEDLLKTCLGDVFQTSWRQTKCLLGIPVCNKCKCVFNKSVFHKSISDESKANPKCIN